VIDSPIIQTLKWHLKKKADNFANLYNLEITGASIVSAEKDLHGNIQLAETVLLKDDLLCN